MLTVRSLIPASRRPPSLSLLLPYPYISTTISPYEYLCLCLRIFRDNMANGVPAGRRKTTANIFLPSEWRGRGDMVKGLDAHTRKHKYTDREHRTCA